MTQERVELHVHSKYSCMDGIASPYDIVEFAKKNGMSAVALTDHGSIKGYPELEWATCGEECKVKPIYGIEAYIINDFEKAVYNNKDQYSHDRKGPTFHATVLIKDLEGKKILYNLISSAEQYNEERDVFLLSSLVENQEHLLLGSGCEAGILFQAVLDGKSDELICDIAKKFDFIEVQPHTNNRYLIESDRYPQITTEQDLININLELISIGDKIGIPVVATGDVHYIHEEDKISRNVLMAYRGFTEDDDTDLHFRTTHEMLNAFTYLNKEKAEEIVIHNSNLIANMCQRISFMPKKRFYPYDVNQEKELRELCLKEAANKFGNPIPEKVLSRLEWELEAVHNSDTEFSFIYLHDLIENLGLEPYEINTRGCAGNILICYLIGISDINPLEYGLSSLFVFGSKKEKQADIDVNFSLRMQKEAQKKYTSGREIGMTLLAGDEVSISEEGAEYAVKEYEEIRGIRFDEKKRSKIVGDLVNVFKENCIHPGEVVVIPKGKELCDFSPLMIASEGIEATYFNYYRLDHCLFKQDLLHDVGLDILEELESETGSLICNLTYMEPQIMSLFTMENEEGELECVDLPEYRYQTSQQILKQVKPKNFGGLVKVIGLCHGTDVWLNNAELLLTEGIASLSEIIATRDDVFDYLIEHGIEELDAFTITEQIRKGIWASGNAKRYDQYVEMMREADIPQWYIDSCKKICYLFPRAHAISYARLNWRLAWYKIHYPQTYEMVAKKYL